ncbi:hypothetical protein HGB25_02225 [Candidatus Saccharibacteria bacterium]|nr:hypothetical protein [Candidatus Saccharibacteria bacterium]
MSATFLRLNNIGMVERRSAVISADNQGETAVTQARLYELQRYVTAHMNTDMGKGLYLEGSYKRAVQAAYASASASSNPNGNIYKKAQAVCEPRFTHWSPAYVQCTASELAKYPASDNLLDSIDLPRADIYLYDYVSPLWTPDFAGWSVVICVVIFIMIVSRLTGVIILRIILKRRYQGI